MWDRLLSWCNCRWKLAWLIILKSYYNARKTRAAEEHRTQIDICQSACLCLSYLKMKKKSHCTLSQPAHYLQWFNSIGQVCCLWAFLSILNRLVQHLGTLGSRSGQSLAQAGMVKSILFQHNSEMHATTCRLVGTGIADHRASDRRSALDSSPWASEK